MTVGGGRRLLAVACSIGLAAYLAGCDRSNKSAMTNFSEWGPSSRVVSNGVEPNDTSWRVVEDLTIRSTQDVVLENPTDVAAGPNGRVFVLDQFAGDVKVFDDQGELEVRLGRLGRGPGELTNEASRVLLVDATTVVVVDYGNRRLQRFHVETATSSEMSLALARRLPLEWAVHPDGFVVAATRRSPFLAMVTGGSSDLTLRAYRNGGSESLFSVELGGDEGGTPEAGLLAPRPVFAIMPSGNLVLGNGADYRLTVLGVDGEPLLGFEREFERRRISEVEKESLAHSFGDFLVESGLPQEAAKIAVQRSTRVADTYPAFVQLLADDRGRIWVQRPASVQEIVSDESRSGAGGSTGGREWDVFDGDGVYIARLSLPSGFRLTSVREDKLYGYGQTEFGEPIVTRLRLKSGPGM